MSHRSRSFPASKSEADPGFRAVFHLVSRCRDADHRFPSIWVFSSPCAQVICSEANEALGNAAEQCGKWLGQSAERSSTSRHYTVSPSSDAIIGREGHWQSRVLRNDLLVAEIAPNSLAQWPAAVGSAANPRKSPRNFAIHIFSSYIRDLLADRRGFELPIGFSKYPFEMSAKFPLMCRKMAP
jgi:hypothetical protein